MFSRPCGALWPRGQEKTAPLLWLPFTPSQLPRVLLGSFLSTTAPQGPCASSLGPFLPPAWPFRTPARSPAAHPTQQPQNNLKTHLVTGQSLPGHAKHFLITTTSNSQFSAIPSPCAPQNFSNCDYALTPVTDCHVFQVWVYILCFHSLSSQRYSKMFASLHLLVQPRRLHRPDSSCVVALISMPVPMR